MKLSYQAFTTFVGPEYAENMRRYGRAVEIVIAGVSDLTKPLEVLGKLR
jgi:hypothetical protein